MNQSAVMENAISVQPNAFLGNTDYVVIAVMLIISSSIGLYFRFSGGKQKTTHEFLMAGRNMSVFPVAFSIMASGNSAITYLGAASDTYIYGTQFVFISIGIVCGALTACYLFLPIFFNNNISTTYEYLEKRFGRTLRIICSLSFSLQAILYIAVVLYAPALALSAVTSLSMWTSVISVGVVCTFYCTLGGMKAVLWTDVFQALLMYGGLFVLVAKGCHDVGGFHAVWERSRQGGRLIIPKMDIDFVSRYTMLNTFMSGFVTTLFAYGASQMQVQRLLTVNCLKKAVWAITSSLPISSIFLFVNCLSGLVVYANFYKCDPLTSDHISKPDQILPYFALRSLGFYPGIAGLLVCGILSAALSTMSSMVNSLTTVTIEDFARPFFPSISDTRASFFAKLITLCYGGVALLLTYVVTSFGNLLQASNIVYGAVAGPVLGVFLLGALTSRTNEKGAIIGLLLSFSITVWISFGGVSTNSAHPKLPLSTEECPHLITANQTSAIATISTLMSPLEQPISATTEYPVTERDEKYIFPLYKISYMWISPIGMTMTIIFGYASSYFFKKPVKINKNLLSPIAHMCNSSGSLINHKADNVEIIDLHFPGEKGVKD